MKLLLGVFAVSILVGCVSKSASHDRARSAFLEGQKAGAAATIQSTQQAQAKVVTVLGEVRNSVVPWTEGLSLAQAILAAQHVGTRSPRAIILRHGDQSAMFDTHFILQTGHEIPLEPGDVIELVR